MQKVPVLRPLYAVLPDAFPADPLSAHSSSSPVEDPGQRDACPSPLCSFSRQEGEHPVLRLPSGQGGTRVLRGPVRELGAAMRALDPRGQQNTAGEASRRMVTKGTPTRRSLQALGSSKAAAREAHCLSHPLWGPELTQASPRAGMHV